MKGNKTKPTMHKKKKKVFKSYVLHRFYARIYRTEILESSIS